MWGVLPSSFSLAYTYIHVGPTIEMHMCCCVKEHVVCYFTVRAPLNSKGNRVLCPWDEWETELAEDSVLLLRRPRSEKHDAIFHDAVFQTRRTLQTSQDKQARHRQQRTAIQQAQAIETYTDSSVPCSSLIKCQTSCAVVGLLLLANNAMHSPSSNIIISSWNSLQTQAVVLQPRKSCIWMYEMIIVPLWNNSVFLL